MKAITFIDTEIDPQTGKILDLGGIKEDDNIFHKASATTFSDFIKGSHFVCGHNILNHDILYIGKLLEQAGTAKDHIIDTLYLSPLLFPSKPYHALVKDDKLQYDELSNPLNDAIKARDLFFDEVATFKQLSERCKDIFSLLLKNDTHFQAFFKFIDYPNVYEDVADLIQKEFNEEICSQANLKQFISDYPVELAYCLAMIKATNRTSLIPLWVLKNYPDVDRIMFLLRNRPCISGCRYCDRALDAHFSLKKYFGHNNFREYSGEPLQEKAVKAAINNKSFLAVFPTGGGKSITFQVPALMNGENTRALTVVISPLQSLMKDQVDNLEKAGITDAVTINGLLDPIERAKSIERVEDGSACMLYIAPESLRSNTIERLLLGRRISRFVIDEAHCFSSWGQDFRVDYQYIGDFLKHIQLKKNLDEPIPVSCFTATAKPKVIEDICDYFRDKLDLQLDLFTTNASRTNLHYKVVAKADEEEKYLTARDLITAKNCPAIIYVSRTRTAVELAKRLATDGLEVRAFHGKMEAKEKIENQNAFLSGEVKVIVATSAFGMGVDKKDVGLVIHYDISDSLENYLQEAGRAGRDENITADCYVLYNEDDLSKHFILLNQTKLSIREIQQVWKAVKDLSRFRKRLSNSALEIARKAGWDDSVADIETRVTTAIAALEDAGYLKRGQNSPRVYANSILSKTAQEAIDKIYTSERFTENQKEKAVRIIKKLFSSKNRKKLTEEVPESRVDYISDHLGIVKEDVITIINLLREENILADAKDLTAYIKRGENKNRSLGIVETFSKIERHLLPFISEEVATLDIKELNEHIENQGVTDVTPNKIKAVTNFWAIKNWLRRKSLSSSKNHFKAYSLFPIPILKERIEKRNHLAGFIVGYLYGKTNALSSNTEELLVYFSVLELKQAYELSNDIFKAEVGIEDVEDALFYLSKIEAIKIEGGFLVVYNQLTLNRLELDNKKRYKENDYQKLKQFYENKVQQIHIVGEYAEKMIDNYKEALQFVDDYFQLNYSSFLNKHFKGSKQQDLALNITPAKFRKLFGELSLTQLNIIKDDVSKHIVVAAGPGSGKTKVLVHKLASLLLMEDVKHEQLLMLTFSRAAATEFKKRLLNLIGNAANFIEIKTFHSYCFDLLGKVGSIEKSDTILKQTIDKIKNKDVDANRITKTVLVIDEAQDMDEDEFTLIQALMDENEEMRVIAVGDDDQNIYQFRGSNSKYLQQLITVNSAVKYELIENYRSKSNLVEFANQFAAGINNRLKTTPIFAQQQEIGKIKICCYEYDRLVVPLVKDILDTPLIGTVCVLTKTNEEALQITGLLVKNGIPARLVQTNDDFNLWYLAEIRFLFEQFNTGDQAHVITNEVWESAKRKAAAVYKNSDNWLICENLIRDFETTNPRQKYKSDLEVLVRESKLEDFYQHSRETIFVSTIHKAKGKEFDNVFLMLENLPPLTDDLKRQLYVAITRAKENLSIHTNSDEFDKINITNLEFAEFFGQNEPPDELITNLTHKDVWLDFFQGRQHLISVLRAGNSLVISDNECLNSSGQAVLRFSNPCLTRINGILSKGYRIKSVKVNFVVYWKKENSEQEIPIILPKIHFEKYKRPA